MRLVLIVINDENDGISDEMRLKRKEANFVLILDREGCYLIFFSMQRLIRELRSHEIKMDGRIKLGVINQSAHCSVTTPVETALI